MFGLIDAACLVLGRDSPAQGLECEADDRRQNAGEDECCECDHDLNHQLLVVAAVEEAGCGAEESDTDRAPQAGDKVNTDDVERVVEAEAELQADCESGQDAGYGAEEDGTDGVERTGSRGDGDQTGDRTGSCAEAGGVTVTNTLGGEPGQDCGTRRGGRVDPGETGVTVGGECRTGVEAEPTEPEKCGAEHHEGQVVRTEGGLAEAEDACRR